MPLLQNLIRLPPHHQAKRCHDTEEVGDGNYEGTSPMLASMARLVAFRLLTQFNHRAFRSRSKLLWSLRILPCELQNCNLSLRLCPRNDAFPALVPIIPVLVPIAF